MSRRRSSLLQTTGRWPLQGFGTAPYLSGVGEAVIVGEFLVTGVSRTNTSRSRLTNWLLSDRAPLTSSRTIRSRTRYS